MTATANPDDALKLLRPAFLREIREIAKKIHEGDLTDEEMAAVALLYRSIYARVQELGRVPAPVVKLKLAGAAGTGG